MGFWLNIKLSMGMVKFFEVRKKSKKGSYKLNNF